MNMWLILACAGVLVVCGMCCVVKGGTAIKTTAEIEEEWDYRE